MTPLKLQKAGDTGDSIVEKSNKPQYQGNKLVARDTFCTETSLYHLLYGNDTKNCLRKVIRRKYCKTLFILYTLYLSRQKGRDRSLVQNRGEKNVMQPMFICTTYRVA